MRERQNPAQAGGGVPWEREPPTVGRMRLVELPGPRSRRPWHWSQSRPRQPWLSVRRGRLLRSPWQHGRQLRCGSGGRQQVRCRKPGILKREHGGKAEEGHGREQDPHPARKHCRRCTRRAVASIVPSTCKVIVSRITVATCTMTQEIIAPIHRSKIGLVTGNSTSAN